MPPPLSVPGPPSFHWGLVPRKVSPASTRALFLAMSRSACSSSAVQSISSATLGCPFDFSPVILPLHSYALMTGAGFEDHLRVLAQIDHGHLAAHDLKDRLHGCALILAEPGAPAAHG